MAQVSGLIRSVEVEFSTIARILGPSQGGVNEAQALLKRPAKQPGAGRAETDFRVCLAIVPPRTGPDSGERAQRG